ncbi:MAG: hypothetical protein A4E51_01404 [Methanosaeta sp. PtaU1.Bin055]|nr:MAG: hypothetical protein A4E51_01404 [Methanosaeta sp. PtaU1.Bin055]
MRKKTTRIFVLFLLFFGIEDAAAEDFQVPGDLDGDPIVSSEELEIAEQDQKEGKITPEDLEKIRHISGYSGVINKI